MRVRPGLPLSPPLRKSAEEVLATAVNALEPRRGLLLIQLRDSWTEAAVFGVPLEFWRPDIVAVEAIHTVAAEWKAQLFADTGAPTDSPLAFLQGNLSSVMVLPAEIHSHRSLLYLARPFADGLYQKKHLDLCRDILEGTPPKT